MVVKSGIEKWRELDGDNTLALDWPLNEDSHVWEIGGFEGRWAQQIWDKFHCNITIFEPQLWAVEKMKERFKGIDKIEIRPYGLSIQNMEMYMSNYFTDGAKMGGHKEPREVGKFVDYREVFSEVPYEIDLCLMNIEGAEYTLIPDLIMTNAIGFINYFWCQFHPDNENDDRHVGIILNMLLTHEIMWSYYPTAVAWKKR